MDTDYLHIKKTYILWTHSETHILTSFIGDRAEILLEARETKRLATQS